MEFSELIQKIRKENQLTQQQMADRLFVTRQAVSNWENNKNLPDFYQIMDIAKTYHISLDELIPKEETNKLTEKLINDSKNITAIKRNNHLHTIGFVLLLLGLLCIMFKAFLPSTIDEEGMLQEAFFLLPIGFALTSAGLMFFTIALLINAKELISKKMTIEKSLPFILLEVALLSLAMLFFSLLIMGNSGTNMMLAVIICIVVFAAALGGWLTLSVVKKQ